MRQGRRWIVLDADYFTNDFTEQLGERFGWAGIGTFVALLCAAKKNYPQGAFSYTTELEAKSLLGIVDRPLVNDKGEEWTLEEFFRFCGLRRMVRRPSRHLSGRRRHLDICQWDLWQTAAERLRDLERKRTSRAKTKPDTLGTLSETGSDNVPLKKEKDQEKEKDFRAHAREAAAARPPAANGTTQNKETLRPKNENDRPPDDIRLLKESLTELANGATPPPADQRPGRPIRKSAHG